MKRWTNQSKSRDRKTKVIKDQQPYPRRHLRRNAAHSAPGWCVLAFHAVGEGVASNWGSPHKQHRPVETTLFGLHRRVMDLWHPLQRTPRRRSTHSIGKRSKRKKGIRIKLITRPPINPTIASLRKCFLRKSPKPAIAGPFQNMHGSLLVDCPALDSDLRLALVEPTEATEIDRPRAISVNLPTHFKPLRQKIGMLE